MAMARHDIDELREEEYPDPEDWSDDSVAVVACPSCGEMIHEEVQQCPYCRDWVVLSPGRASRGSGFWLRAAVVGLVVLGLLSWVIF